MDKLPGPGEIYQHFKGQLYRVITLALHSESGEQLVVYQALYGDFQVYARPLSLFVGEVDHEKYPGVSAKQRFTLIPAAGPQLVETDTARIPRNEAEYAQTHTENQIPHEESVRAADDDMAEGETALDPRLLAFLEADSYQRKLEIFASLTGRADEHMLNTIAVSLDLELSGDTVEEQYEALKNCMLTLEKYECTRLR